MQEFKFRAIHPPRPSFVVKIDFFNRGQKINANFFCTKFLDNPSGHGRPRRKSWTSAPKSAFSCGPGGGEKLFDPGASGCKGQECPREIRTKKFMFMLFFFPDSSEIEARLKTHLGTGQASTIILSVLTCNFATKTQDKSKRRTLKL